MSNNKKIIYQNFFSKESNIHSKNVKISFEEISTMIMNHYENDPLSPAKIPIILSNYEDIDINKKFIHNETENTLLSISCLYSDYPLFLFIVNHKDFIMSDNIFHLLYLLFVKNTSTYWNKVTFQFNIFIYLKI